MLSLNKIINSKPGQLQDNLNRQITVKTQKNNNKKQSINQPTIQKRLPSSHKEEAIDDKEPLEQVSITTPYLFDWEYYLERYPDLRTNGVQTEHEAITHWCSFGEKEERVAIRTPYLFDWNYYFERYPDLRMNGVQTEHQAIAHWYSFGEKEERVAIRRPELFDWKYYLERYPDLRINGVKTEHQAITHWYSFGEKEKRMGHAEPVKVVDLFSPMFIDNIAKKLVNILKDCGLDVNLHIRNIENSDIIKCNEEWGRFLFICCPQIILQLKNRTEYPIHLMPLPNDKYILYQFDIFNDVMLNHHIINLIRGSKHTFDFSEVNLRCYPNDLLDRVSYLTPPEVE
jgi:hypothetical protein